MTCHKTQLTSLRYRTGLNKGRCRAEARERGVSAVLLLVTFGSVGLWISSVFRSATGERGEACRRLADSLSCLGRLCKGCSSDRRRGRCSPMAAQAHGRLLLGSRFSQHPSRGWPNALRLLPPCLSAAGAAAPGHLIPQCHLNREASVVVLVVTAQAPLNGERRRQSWRA